jgi:hypothetical protein
MFLPENVAADWVDVSDETLAIQYGMVTSEEKRRGRHEHIELS